jgi:ribosomal protein L37AE/L43A
VKRKFFFDTLNKVLIGAAIVLILLAYFGFTTAYLFAGVFLTLGILRMYSRDYQARARENDIFKNFLNRQRAKSNAKKAVKVRRIRPVYEGRAGESTMHQAKEKAPKSDSVSKIFKCPKCKQALRVPRGKGKILITCQSCGHKFEKKT